LSDQINLIPFTDEKAMKLILIVILLCNLAGCTKADMKTPPATPINEKSFSVEKRQIIFIKHEYLIKNLEQEGKKK
jgi:type IV pilus biogenesis protein CpaD/CtpE